MTGLGRQQCTERIPKSQKLRSQHYAYRRCRTISKYQIRMRRCDVALAVSLIRVSTTKNLKTSPETLNRRKGCCKIGLMDSTCTRYCDNLIVLILFMFRGSVLRVKSGFEFRGFRGTEAVSGGHDVCPKSVDVWV